MTRNDNHTKSVLITGANGGMGKETTKLLIRDGFGRIVMGGRSASKIEAARQEVVEAVRPGADVEIDAVAGFDMNDPAQIRAAVDALPADRPFDVIFLQAGGVVFTKDFDTVRLGGHRYEKTIFQNVIGGHLTLSALRSRGLVAPGARVIIAGGEGARGLPGLIASPDFPSPQALRSYATGDFADQPKYNPMNAMGVSKFAGALWSMKLAELTRGEMDVIWFSPGLTYGTDGLADKPPVQRWFLENVAFGLMRLLGRAQSPQDGARKYADAIEQKVGRSGDVIGAPEGTALGPLTDQRPMHPGFGDPTLRDAFWEVVEQVAGPWSSRSAA